MAEENIGASSYRKESENIFSVKIVSNILTSIAKNHLKSNGLTHRHCLILGIWQMFTGSKLITLRSSYFI
ncbi:MAG: hypothetical protein C4519_26990 [Desulfobacteraceae bacterium]|nr:MAG: hypothetical protein C4519_26990 [Desulfobacteraceae bacterium]